MTLPTAPAERKAIPVATGFIDYFPDATIAVAELSHIGNDQHNPGKPLHWDRSKSGDEADALMRHFVERGTVDTDGVRHSTKVAWRAMALLQKELEKERAKPKSMMDVISEMRDEFPDCVTRAPETKFGFTVGETVNLKSSDRGYNPGVVTGFRSSRYEVLVRWANITIPSAFAPYELRHGE